MDHRLMNCPLLLRRPSVQFSLRKALRNLALTASAFGLANPLLSGETGTANPSAAIQHAIDTCGRAGGGTVSRPIRWTGPRWSRPALLPQGGHRIYPFHHLGDIHFPMTQDRASAAATPLA